ncbi:ribonuclease J [Natroniella sulfidigena]|uniref:ribonuclease J n=1 Tax=Natroniella sulfidigena TaxID=723921 RepID=UPI00200B82DC|nr:ribonuclease J [Natroniella sulfidigena]MCK8816458.1 ribonuclease J [Natroniella sulfidigena]
MSNNKIGSVTVVPLGGIGEIGKNMMAVEVNDEILIIDSGVKFPEDDLYGIDLVIPDMSYLFENRDKIQGVVLTHGHEDHIGGIPYLLKKINVPVYGTKLTLGLLRGKLESHNLLSNSYLKHVYPGHSAQVGSFKVEFIRVNHSIQDACALAVHTPAGPLVYASDFKFDQTPIDGKMADLHKLAELGDEGVLALFSDSTNVEREGFTMSEREVKKTIDEIYEEAERKVIVASFASNINRIQQVFDAAMKYDRKVALSGRSMLNNVQIAKDLGYLDIPEGMLIDLHEVKKLPDHKVVLLTTGSQGEPRAALTRIARGDHRQISIDDGDTVIVSATAIPGNVKAVGRTINQLFKQGANVVYEAVSGVHVSGHASQEELKLMLNLTKPKYFFPVHGEYRHLHLHAKLAETVGVPKENIFIPDLGDKIRLTPEEGQIEGSVKAGRVLIDGLGVGDVGNIVLRDRRVLSENGILMVVVTINSQGKVLSGPDIISRGFVYIRESEQLIEDATKKVEKALSKCEENNVTEWSVLKSEIRDALNNYLYNKIRRKPMILPIIMEV